ncbi:hypothetical protein MBLNU459_g7049t1 [Dothideomycetes sp. NU459]
MPSVQSGATVLVTGANGFIAAHCIRKLLADGFKVRGTVRSMGKAAAVVAAHSESLAAASKLDIVQVADLCDEAQWSAVLPGCDAVLHLASTFRYDVAPGDFEAELLRPAVDGTTALLAAANKEKSVKRVVLMSSFAAVYDASKGLQPGKVYTEEDWCPITWKEGAEATQVPVAYRASKALAEKAAWNFIDEEKPAFDLVSLCPGMVFGPLIQPIGSLSNLNASNQIVWGVINGQSSELPPTKAPIFTDASDLANASVDCLGIESTANRRYLVASGTYDTQEIADIVRELMPDHAASIPVGEPGKRIASTHYSISNARAEKEIGISFSKLKRSIIPLARQLYEMQSSEKAAS